jgi:hypothetical protein
MTIPEIFIGQIWVVVSLFLAGLYLLIGRRGRAAQRLRREGITGRATILEMTQTGVYVNEQPRVKFRLRVEADGLEPYEVEKTVVVPLIALGTLTSGRPLTVYIDRTDPDRFVIDWAAGMAPPPESARREVLDALRRDGIDAAHEAAASAPMVPIAPQAQDEEPLERLTKLMQLKGAQLITDDEFEEHRKRILASI